MMILLFLFCALRNKCPHYDKLYSLQQCTTKYTIKNDLIKNRKKKENTKIIASAKQNNRCSFVRPYFDGHFK